MKKILLILLLVPLIATSANDYRIGIIGDSNTKVFFVSPMRFKLSNISPYWKVQNVYSDLNYNGAYFVLAGWDTLITPFLTDTNRLWITWSTAIHEVEYPQTAAQWAVDLDTCFSRLHRIIGHHFILRSYPRIGWNYSSFKDSQVVIFNDTARAVADRIFGAGGYIRDSASEWQQSYGDSALKHTADGLHWNSNVYGAWAIRLTDILKNQAGWVAVAATPNYSYTTSGNGAIDNHQYADSTKNYCYTSSGITENDLLGDTLTTSKLTITNKDTTYFNYPIYTDSLVIHAPAGKVVAQNNAKIVVTVCSPSFDISGWGGTLPPITYPTTGPISRIKISASVGAAVNSSRTNSGCTADSIVKISGTLPPGDTINRAIGALQGTSTTAGTYIYTVRAYNNAATTTADATDTVTVVAATSVNKQRRFWRGFGLGF